jgi:hypothetical protein
MNKTIFEVGLLSFCVASVMFGTQGMGLLETVAHAFIVFMAVVSGIALVLVVSASFTTKADPAQTPSAGDQPETAGTRRSQQTTA